MRNRNHRAENGVQNATLWRALLGVEKTVVEEVEFDEHEQLLVAHVRRRGRARTRARCGRCERRKKKALLTHPWVPCASES